MEKSSSTEAVSAAPTAKFLLRHALAGTTAGLLGAAGAAALIASHGVAAQGLPFVPTWGLVAPFTFALACLVGPWIALVDLYTNFPVPARLLARKEDRWRTLLSGPALVCAWFLIGQLALRLLAAFHERLAMGGVLVALSSLGGLVVLAWGVKQLTTWLGRFDSAPGWRVSFAVAVLFPVVFVPTLIFAGTTSGVGSPIALFGVFRRAELDLTPVAHLGLSLAGIYACAYFGVRRSLAALSLGALVPWLATIWAMSAAVNLEFRSAVSIERSRGLAAMALSVARRVDDADGDGFSPRFGGGDCDDSNPQVHPGAVDIPDNGIDEDCRGGDKKKAAVPLEGAAGSSVPVAHRLPDDANVLLLTIDTLRWDLGFMSPGARPGLSPKLDALAKRSTVFEHAYSYASYTSKSLGPMMIGRYPSETRRTFEHFDRFSPDVPWIQERVQKAGVHTRSVQGYWYFFFEKYGFERGWDELDSSSAPKAVVIEGDRTSNGDELADRTIHHLGEMKKADKRFFLWTHWVDPHTEYVPHEEFDFGREPRERYDGEVAFVDHQIGRVLAALDDLSLEKETIVIITSDHGEAFGEHGMIRHGFEVWDVLVRVPLIVHVPGAAPRRVEPRRGFVDIAPTILEAFGIEIAPTDDDFVRGTSLFRDVLAPEGAPLAERPVLVDMPEGPHNRERRAFYQGDYKLITTNGQVIGLYDLASDPEELKDLSDDREKVAKMEAAMNEFLDGLAVVPATR